MISANDIFGIKNHDHFIRVAIDVFKWQAANIKVYKDYIERLKINVVDVDDLVKIPFLPIQFFKTREVRPENTNVDVVFSSSGTTGDQTSKHYVVNKELYLESFFKSFKQFYGEPLQYCILALLPSYLEREGSSLVYMVDKLIQLSANTNSGFFLNEYEILANRLRELDNEGQKCILIGVSFALIDFIEEYQFELKNTIIMETGGMKGRRREMVREELHNILCKGFGVDNIHSEYGMTELLSQAYSKGSGVFQTPPWMKVIVRDPYDPFTILPSGRSGAVNIIDLANINSCSFIQTEDVGRTFDDSSFEILGRMDEAQIRGCNLLVY